MLAESTPVSSAQDASLEDLLYRKLGLQVVQELD
jgi:hypothetical protein